MVPGNDPPADQNLVESLKTESLFPAGNERFDLSPTSNGFPDVDTYRAFEFYIEENFVAVNGVELDAGEITLAVGEEQTLTANVLPAGATNSEVTWVSSVPYVAEVDNGGKVTAMNPGLTAISAITKEGLHTATCMVTVTDTATAVIPENADLSGSIRVNPNPVSDGRLRIESGKSVIREVRVLSVDGKIVFQQNFNSTKVEIDLLNLPSGPYLSLVKCEGGIARKVVMIE